jgi:hypothetical protein
VRDSFIPDDSLEDSDDRARFDDHRIAVAADWNRLFDGLRREGSAQRAVGLFCPTTARCPFGYDTGGTREPLLFGPLPQLGAIARSDRRSQVDLAAWNRAG